MFLTEQTWNAGSEPNLGNNLFTTHMFPWAVIRNNYDTRKKTKEMQNTGKKLARIIAT